MQSVRWTGFGISNALTRMALHFFPSAGNVSAPYPVTCKLTIFAAGLEPISIAVDGLRLSQPEGVWMDEAFPAIKAQNLALYAVEVSMSCTQQRVDLSSSSCIFEFCSPGQSIRFLPILSDRPAPNTGPQIGAAIKDGFCSSSILLANFGSSACKPEIVVGIVGSNEPKLLGLPKSLAEIGLPARALIEVELEEIFMSGFAGELAPVECSWGLVRSRALEVKAAEGLCAFMVYRDNLTKRPLSITAL